MAKQSGLGDQFYIGGYDLSGDVSAISKMSGGPAVQDVTAINKSAHERIGLLRDASWTIASFFDNAAGAEHLALSTLPVTDTIACYFRGSTVGNSAAAMNSKQIDYDPTRANTGNLTLKVDLQANSFGMEWGIMLTPGLRTDTSATAGSFYQDIGQTAFGGQAYLQLTAFTGTSVTVAIQHATTSGGSYSNVIAFTSMNAIGSQRAFVSNVTTIDQFLKVTTTGTFSNAVFSVVFVRNQIAGQVF